MFKSLFACLFGCCLVSLASAACLPEEKIQQLVNGYPSNPATGLTQVASLDEAYCTQKQYVSLLQKRAGKIVGYKIGFTGKASQQRFKMSGPATGVLLDNMFLDDNSVIDKHFGHRPLIEPDFMVVIKDKAIMQAKTARETLEFIETVHPLLELPAVQISADEPMSGTSVVALNIAATFMVAGAGINAKNTDEFFTELAQIKTVFTSESDANLQTANSNTLMGHPLNALLWLVSTMNERGEMLQAGDKISLGATGKLFPILANQYHYEFQWPSGEKQTVSIKFK